MNRTKRRKYFRLLERKCKIRSNHLINPETGYCACEWVKMEHQSLPDGLIKDWAVSK